MTLLMTPPETELQPTKPAPPSRALPRRVAFQSAAVASLLNEPVQQEISRREQQALARQGVVAGCD